MKKILQHISFLAVIAAIISCTGNLFSQAQNQKCLICHGKPGFSVKTEDGRLKNLFVSDSTLKSSPHTNIFCYDCHNDIVEITALGHKKDVKKVQCTHCHFENNPVGAPETEKYAEFQESVHNQERLKGNDKTPICQTCHGSHDIKKRKSLSELDLKKKITQMCGQCHLDIYSAYSQSIHGTSLFEKNNADAPVCTNCHGEHTIKKKDDPASKVYKTAIFNTCGDCHASEKIFEKYGIKADKLETYEESYHGIAVQLGEKTVANCASCHGVHDIRPQDDPRSTINANNIVKTCGKCHQDANANYTKGKIHINPKSEESGSIYYISSVFKWLTIITLTLLAIHILLDLLKRLRQKAH